MFRFLPKALLMACCFLSAASARADILDFSLIVPQQTDFFGERVTAAQLDLGNAIVTSTNNYFAVTNRPSPYGTGLCGITLGNNGSPCNATVDIQFNQSVFDLTFVLAGLNPHDLILNVQAFSGGTLIGEYSPATMNDTFVDLSGFGLFDRLTLGYQNAIVSGATYNDFRFKTVSAVPLPAALPLFGGALLGLGYLTRRKKKKNSLAN